MTRICNIGEFAYSIPVYRQFSVHHFHRNNLKTVDIEWVVIYNIHFKCRDSGIRMLSKAVIKTAVKIRIDICPQIYRHILIAAKRTKIIKTSDMVVMTVCDKDRINIGKTQIQGLLAKIRGRINQQPQTGCLDKDRGFMTASRW